MLIYTLTINLAIQNINYAGVIDIQNAGKHPLNGGRLPLNGGKYSLNGGRHSLNGGKQFFIADDISLIRDYENWIFGDKQDFKNRSSVTSGRSLN
jgi:hypothetical protein